MTAEEIKMFFFLTKTYYIIERNSNYFPVCLEGGKKDFFLASSLPTVFWLVNEEIKKKENFVTGLSNCNGLFFSYQAFKYFFLLLSPCK